MILSRCEYLRVKGQVRLGQVRLVNLKRRFCYIFYYQTSTQYQIIIHLLTLLQLVVIKENVFFLSEFCHDISQHIMRRNHAYLAFARIRINPYFPLAFFHCSIDCRVFRRNGSSNFWMQVYVATVIFTWADPDEKERTKHAPVLYELNGRKDSGARTRCSSFCE